MKIRDLICVTKSPTGRVRTRTAKSAAVAVIALALFLGASRLQAQQGQSDDGGFSMGPQGRMVRGTVTSVSADRLAVKTEGGDVFQVSVTTNTRLMKDRQPVKFAEIRVGDGIGAMGVLDAQAKTIHAAALFVVDAAQVKKLREDMGKTYISGKVIAIDEVELTIHRQDGVTQKITVDEGTSFKRGGRRAGMAMRGDGSADVFAGGGGEASGGPGGPGQGGESITLADVKVGDTVVGPGALKGGVFIPTQLTVIDAAAMARRKRPEGAGGPDQAPGGAGPH